MDRMRPTILGARTISQLETNLRAARLHLTAAETATLDAASDPHPTDYPYGEVGVEQRARTLPAATEHRRRARPVDQDDELADVLVWVNTQHSRDRLSGQAGAGWLLAQEPLPGCDELAGFGGPP
jgi:hypothetical protein